MKISVTLIVAVVGLVLCALSPCNGSVKDPHKKNHTFEERDEDHHTSEGGHEVPSYSNYRDEGHHNTTLDGDEGHHNTTLDGDEGHHHTPLDGDEVPSYSEYGDEYHYDSEYGEEDHHHVPLDEGEDHQHTPLDGDEDHHHTPLDGDEDHHHISVDEDEVDLDRNGGKPKIVTAIMNRTTKRSNKRSKRGLKYEQLPKWDGGREN